MVAGDNQGTVKKISVRATEIETFQRQTVIVPNSVFINSAVGNWTHRNKIGRVDLKVGVAYGTDARRAAEIMDGIVRAHPLVLRNPEPMVVFLNFGPVALEFELRFFLADVLNGSSSRTTFALRFSKNSIASGSKFRRIRAPSTRATRSHRLSAAAVPDEPEPVVAETPAEKGPRSLNSALTSHSVAVQLRSPIRSPQRGAVCFPEGNKRRWKHRKRKC